jgi:hypothetical protein
MGNLQGEQATATTKPAGTPANAVSPAPKGDRQGKPSAGAASGAPAPKQNRVQNPTYIHAVHDVEKYFQQQADVAYVMGTAVQTGFELFKGRTSEEYNRAAPGLEQLFSLALSAVPAGQSILSVLKAIKTAEKLTKLAEATEKLSGLVEAVAPVKELHEKGAAIAETQEAKSAGHEHVNFEMEAAEGLLDLALDSVHKRWEKQADIDTLLDAVEFVDASIDLRGVMRQALGPIPTFGEVEAAAKRTTVEFEYLLYYQYYAENGIGVHVEYDRSDGSAGLPGSNTDDITNVPPPVIERVKSLGKYDDFRKGIVAFHTIHRQTVGKVSKPY